jgi:hypothetical protein
MRDATAAGDWGATLTGTLLLPTGPVPSAAVVRAAFNAQGNITQATEARNLGGDFANETITGAWTVGADCTGTLKINAYESGTLVRTSVLAIVLDQKMGKSGWCKDLWCAKRWVRTGLVQQCVTGNSATSVLSHPLRGGCLTAASCPSGRKPKQETTREQRSFSASSITR